MARPSAPYLPFVIAALALTVTVGALSGALNLYHLHVLARPVPVDHHRSHAVAQLFGFMFLLTMGVSFHLAPRLLGGAPPDRRTVRVLAWTGIGGVIAAIVGRLGALVPGSALIGLCGAVAVVVAAGWWLAIMLRLAHGGGIKDFLPRFVVAGTLWWLVAAMALFLWQLGQAAGGPISAMPIEPAYAAALHGGTISWLWGIFLRAGACTLRVARPSLGAQRRGFVAWQGAAVAQLAAAVVPSLAPLASGLSAVAMVVMILVVRPFARPEGVLPGEPLIRRSIQVGFGFALVYAALGAWAALGALGVEVPVLLRDAARHALTLGFAQLLVFGFAGRMVPGFDGVSLPWPRLYDVGLVFLAGGALGRLASLAAPGRLAMAVSGSSGFLVTAGVVMLAACLARSLRTGAVIRRGLAEAPDTRGLTLLTSR